MKNFIYIGDNKVVMESKMNILKNTVDIIYIDPPYNTDQKKSYKDNEYNHSSWKEMMYPRIVLGKKNIK